MNAATSAAEKAAILSPMVQCPNGPGCRHPACRIEGCKSAIPAHLNKQVAALVDLDDLVMDIESAIEHMVCEAGRAELALHKGDYDAAVDILRSAVAHVSESLA